MDTYWFVFLCGILPCLQADNLVFISKRYSNNSYSCFVRHTRDGLEYHLTYNVCILDPSSINNDPAVPNDLPEFHCLYYECTITASELMASDGQLDCFRHAYTPAPSQSEVLDRITTYRRWPVTKFAMPKVPHEGRSRPKRDFSWVTFLEKISFMGRHQSTVSKQNEAYFHYNFMNKPTSGGGSGNRPVQASPPVVDVTTQAVPIEAVNSEPV